MPSTSTLGLLAEQSLIPPPKFLSGEKEQQAKRGSFLKYRCTTAHNTEKEIEPSLKKEKKKKKKKKNFPIGQFSVCQDLAVTLSPLNLSQCKRSSSRYMNLCRPSTFPAHPYCRPHDRTLSSDPSSLFQAIACTLSCLSCSMPPHHHRSASPPPFAQ